MTSPHYDDITRIHVAMDSGCGTSSAGSLQYTQIIIYSMTITVLPGKFRLGIGLLLLLLLASKTRLLATALTSHDSTKRTMIPAVYQLSSSMKQALRSKALLEAPLTPLLFSTSQKNQQLPNSNDDQEVVTLDLANQATLHQVAQTYIGKPSLAFIVRRPG